jgi:DNA helicase-2/ATP-dependent DNA helicase PcrA
VAFGREEIDEEDDALEFPPIDDGQEMGEAAEAPGPAGAPDGEARAQADGEGDESEHDGDASGAAAHLLNEPQAEAASHVDGPLLVFAGAGSGKTRVITYRIANLVAVHRVPPYRVLAVTFTNKAAGEMKSRLETLIGPELARDLWVGTFHAICARLLRRHHDAVGLPRAFVIYDDGDQRAVMGRVVKELAVDDKRFPPRQLLGAIHKHKQEGVAPGDLPRANFYDDLIVRAYEAYERHLAAAGALDFDDLLLRVLRLAEDPDAAAGNDLRRRFGHVLVDEFQDVNQVQYRLVRALSREHGNLCVVGDDDQSIYKWRGADVRIVRGFRRDNPDAKVVKLEQNYRSTGNVVAGALGVIAPSRDREPKELWTANEKGSPIEIVAASSERDEAAFVAGRVRDLLAQDVSPDEIAVFYRVHAQSRVLEEVMRAERVPYVVYGGMRFFERAEIKDVLSYLRVIVNPKSDVDLARIVNVPSRKIGGATIDRLLAFASGRGTSAYDAIVPLCKSDELGTAAKKALARFHALIEELRLEVTGLLPVSPRALADRVLDLSGYRAWLKSDDSAEAEARLQNVDELVGSIAEYEIELEAAGETPTVEGYLERITLATAGDDATGDQPRVSLMTVHAAKGLEFRRVFITGMEEELFPFKSQDRERDDDDEERRLAYVAITRAREQLVITHAQRRMIFGTTRYGVPSRFLADLPRGAIDRDATVLASSGPAPSRYGSDRQGWSTSSSSASTASRGGAWYDEAPSTWQRPAARTAPEPPREPGERWVERDVEAGSIFGEQASSGTLAPGIRVGHASFGVGVVRAVDSGPDPTATVRFSGWGDKRIKIRFLQLA